MLESFFPAASFDRASQQYSSYNYIQSFVFHRLLSFLQVDKASLVVDIGCASGEHTALLADMFSSTTTIGLDSSNKMISTAKRRFLNPNLQFQHASFDFLERLDKIDLIISNASMQWFEDCHSFFNLISLHRARGSQILLSAFLPQTYWQLAAAIRTCINPDFYIPAESFYSQHYYKELCGQFNLDINLSTFKLSTTFKDVSTLMKTIQQTGVTVADHRLHLNKTRIERLDNFFNEHFGCVRVDFEYILLTTYE